MDQGAQILQAGQALAECQAFPDDSLQMAVAELESAAGQVVVRNAADVFEFSPGGFARVHDFTRPPAP
jgi:hypothetical protein